MAPAGTENLASGAPEQGVGDDQLEGGARGINRWAMRWASWSPTRSMDQRRLEKKR
jgi:hypothetical protein